MPNQEKGKSSFADLYLKSYCEKNSLAEVSVEDDHIVIDKPWGRDDARLKAKINDHEFIDALNNLKLTPRFDALFHCDTNVIEFVFAFIDPSTDSYKDLANREFVVHYDGHPYQCRYGEPTERLYKIAKSFEKLPSDVAVKSIPQITPFKDFQNLEGMSDRIKKYFEVKVPRCFFIESPIPLSDISIENLSRHVNLLMGYYDRYCPMIAINPELDQDSFESKLPVRYIEGAFPDALLAHPVDDIVLKLIEVARTSQPRFAFLYYYQVFEYAGYYYIDENTKRSLRNFLKDPALINCGEEKVSELFTMFSDLGHNDDVKMKKVIEEQCDPRVLWGEISNDIEFFSQEHNFEGGFIAKSLIASDTTESSWGTMWMPKAYDHITKIRNSLVHARERRENKVILPSRKNNEILRRYIPLIRRMAEQVALRT